MVAVPWMLLPKPIILNNRFKAVQVQYMRVSFTVFVLRIGYMLPLCPSLQTTIEDGLDAAA